MGYAAPMVDVTYIILAGGAGTRLWPLSTADRPKQFLALSGPRTLLQQAVDRVVERASPDDVFVITASRFVGLCQAQLPELAPAHILGEPMRRDTAAAVLWGTLLAEARRPGGKVVVLTADHVIEPAAALHDDIEAALARADSGEVVTFGIVPDHASTAFGYLDVEGADKVSRVRRFVEKPDLQTARGYVEDGHHLWNSGMFVFRSSDMCEAFAAHLPGHLAALRPAVADGGEDAMRDAFAALAKVSIDYGIMEKLSAVAAVRAGFSWKDLGTFLALEPLFVPDAQGNRGRGAIIAEQAAHNLIVCEDETETVVLLGVSDLVVVRSAGRTLVMDKSRSGALKGVVEGLPEALLVRADKEG